jgi:hypothetical protein
MRRAPRAGASFRHGRAGGHAAGGRYAPAWRIG